MKKGIYIIAALLLTACMGTETKDVLLLPENEVEVEHQETPTEEPTRTKRDSLHSEVKPEAPVQLATYNGAWFQVEYPAKFVPSPTQPTNITRDYRYVDTDEATFTSPDGTVEFFVFSPQWGGDPIDYIDEQPNEKTVDHSEDASHSNDPYPVSHHWVTYEDKEGKYTRSYHSIMTENTHHVFGVKYTNRKMYERYKAAYMDFKKSLKQFAD